MIASMTGYGRCREITDGKDILIEVKSVNNRFLDLNIKTSRLYNFLEEKIKQEIQKYISRGKVDVFLSITELQQKNINIRVDEAYVENYINCLKTMSEKYNLDDDISTMRVAQNRDIFVIEKLDEDETELWNAVKTVLGKSLESFKNMRITEGEKLALDMRERIKICDGNAIIIDELSEKCSENYYTVFKQKLQDFVGDIVTDESRIVTEAAIYADKISITEEIVRLKSHFKQFFNILQEDKPVGRKLEFLVQEINRETNTIGSKSLDINITNKVIEIKSELEKIREQIQNIE